MMNKKRSAMLKYFPYKQLAIGLIVCAAVSAALVMLDLDGKQRIADARVRTSTASNYTADIQFTLEVPGLEGCVYTRVDYARVGSSTSVDTPILHVIRCPHSTTTSEWSIGKAGNRSVTAESK